MRAASRRRLNTDLVLFVDGQTPTTASTDNVTATVTTANASMSTTTSSNDAVTVATQNAIFIGIIGSSLLAVVARL